MDEDMFSYISPPNNAPIPGVVKFAEPLNTTINYFEFKIIAGGAICIGVGPSDYQLDVMPGWGMNSISYASDGSCCHQYELGTNFGPICTVGDKMGCGVDFRCYDISLDLITVFFTKNGQIIGDAVRTKIPTGGLHSLIGMCSEGDKVQYLGHQHYLPQTLKGTSSVVDTGIRIKGAGGGGDGRNACSAL